MRYKMVPLNYQKIQKCDPSKKKSCLYFAKSTKNHLLPGMKNRSVPPNMHLKYRDVPSLPLTVII